MPVQKVCCVTATAALSVVMHGVNALQLPHDMCAGGIIYCAMTESAIAEKIAWQRYRAFSTLPRHKGAGDLT